jgi:hypothetical protein
MTGPQDHHMREKIDLSFSHYLTAYKSTTGSTSIPPGDPIDFILCFGFEERRRDDYGQPSTCIPPGVPVRRSHDDIETAQTLASLF